MQHWAAMFANPPAKASTEVNASFCGGLWYVQTFPTTIAMWPLHWLAQRPEWKVEKSIKRQFVSSRETDDARGSAGKWTGAF